jgi:hypothetical protein
MAEIFAQKPSLLLRVRRDFPRLLALIRACALLHQFQREREMRDGVEHIIANEDDYAIVREIPGPALAPVWMEATPRCRKLVEIAEAFGQGDDAETIHLYDLVKALRWSAPTVRKYAKEAVHLGCLAPQDKPGQWKFIAMVGEVTNPLPASEELCTRRHDASLLLLHSNESPLPTRT